MLQENQKNIYLNIKNVKFPITAIASILHRISGFILFIIFGPMLWIIRLSLSSEDKFHAINFLLINNGYFFKFSAWILITIFSYHMIFGIRQMLMDFGVLKQTLFIGKMSAKIVFLLVIFVFIFLGIYIW